MPEVNKVGDIIEVPGYEQFDEVKPDEILASYARFTQKGVTLKGGQGIIPAGTVLARETSTKKYVVYDNGGSGGAEEAAGFLRQAVDTGGTGSTVASRDRLGNIVISGILKNDLLSGADSAAITDLNARVDSARNWFIF